MGRVHTEASHLFLTRRQVKLLHQGKYIRIRRNGERLTVKMWSKDTRERKLKIRILKLKSQLKALFKKEGIK